MARSIVDAGVCGFRSEIRVISLDGTAVQVTVLSRCPNVTRLAQELDDQTLDGFQEIMRRRRGGHECSPLQALFN